MTQNILPNSHKTLVEELNLYFCWASRIVPTMHTVAFRFHYELNDFLPAEQRHAVFPFGFKGKQTVRDLVEALGVPHSSVGVIEVDGQLVGQEYHVQEYDSIEVFPNREIPRPIKFIADMHMGKLARWLRMLGFDTYYRIELHDPEIAERSATENRIVLTRDLGLLKRNLVQLGHWVRSTNPETQLMEVLKRYHLDVHMKPFTRCMECNGPIAPVALEEVDSEIPEAVAAGHTEFFRCTMCAKVYWKGSHYERMQALILKVRTAGQAGSNDQQET